MWSVRGDHSSWRSRSSLQGHLLWNEDLLWSQGKWREWQTGKTHRTGSMGLGPHGSTSTVLELSLLNAQDKHRCQVEVQAWWKIFPLRTRFQFMSTLRGSLIYLCCAGNNCILRMQLLFWEDLYVSNTGFVGEHWPGVTGWCPHPQNPLLLPGSGHYSRSITMNRHSSAREYCDSSNFLLQLLALLQEKSWGSADFFFLNYFYNLRKETDM